MCNASSYRAPARVVRTKPQDRQQFRQHPVVVAGVGASHDRLDAPIHRALGAVLRDHRLQLRNAGHRIDDIDHPTLRIVNRCLGHIDQQALLPMNPLDVATKQ